MSTITTDIYQTINQASGSTSSNAANVVLENLGEAIGKAEASAVYNTRAKGRPMLLHNPQKESRSRVQRQSLIARQKDDRLRRKANRESRTERRLSKASTQGLKQISTDASSLASPTLLTSSNLNKGHTVKASKCPTLVGCSGIVIEETANVFRIITPDNRVKGKSPQLTAPCHPDAQSASTVLPKQNSIFTFTIPVQPGQEASAQIQFELYGNQFRFRADDRASRKFKSKETIEL
ncbi:RNase P/RNase MRP complex subunit [Ceratobasidium sp. 414]|nr:RNase P/RNase MRP complex subunit [Ceratobasidium sp. 414]